MQTAVHSLGKLKWKWTNTLSLHLWAAAAMGSIPMWDTQVSTSWLMCDFFKRPERLSPTLNAAHGVNGTIFDSCPNSGPRHKLLNTAFPTAVWIFWCSNNWTCLLWSFPRILVNLRRVTCLPSPLPRRNPDYCPTKAQHPSWVISGRAWYRKWYLLNCRKFCNPN